MNVQHWKMVLLVVGVVEVEAEMVQRVFWSLSLHHMLILEEVVVEVAAAAAALVLE